MAAMGAIAFAVLVVGFVAERRFASDRGFASVMVVPTSGTCITVVRQGAVDPVPRAVVAPTAVPSPIASPRRGIGPARRAREVSRMRRQT